MAIFKTLVPTEEWGVSRLNPLRRHALFTAEESIFQGHGRWHGLHSELAQARENQSHTLPPHHEKIKSYSFKT